MDLKGARRVLVSVFLPLYNGFGRRSADCTAIDCVTGIASGLHIFVKKHVWFSLLAKKIFRASGLLFLKT
jgi:hypothetical protein